MQFNPQTIKKRDEYLDKILDQPDLIDGALRIMNINGSAHTVPRIWTPGGGSTFFYVLTSDQKTYFMKVKHISVTVESKLEQETDFINMPAIRNGYGFLMKYQDCSQIPKVMGYTELGGYSFLLLEHLSSFDQGVVALSPEEVIECYYQIENLAKMLFDNDDVHTDFHEKNIMFRGKTPVIIDWEEARHLPQNVSFENSLDYCGKNYLGNVGKAPNFPGLISGYTCLQKIKKVFRRVLAKKLQLLLREAAYNSNSGICHALDHGDDQRSYQSINLPEVSLVGQRPIRDWRVWFLTKIFKILWSKKSVSYIDIGSNMGNFTRAISKLPNVQSSVGIEGTSIYNRVARLLCFLEDTPKSTFVDMIYGQSPIPDNIKNSQNVVYGLLSVYHHFDNPETCLKEMEICHPVGTIVEMARQSECYQGKSWRDILKSISQGLHLPYVYILGYSGDYRRPIAVLLPNRCSLIQSFKLKLTGIIFTTLSLSEWIKQSILSHKLMQKLTQFMTVIISSIFSDYINIWDNF